MACDTGQIRQARRSAAWEGEAGKRAANSFMGPPAGIGMGRSEQARKRALERMDALVSSAVLNARAHPALAAGQAAAARAISTRHRVRMPYGLRMVFCKRCKSFAAPGPGARVRIGRSKVRAVRITCLLCGHTYRRVIPPAAREVRRTPAAGAAGGGGGARGPRQAGSPAPTRGSL